MEFFTPLGERIAADWKKEHHDERAFPAVAEQALRQLESKTDFVDIIRWFNATLSPPAQQLHESTFGNPPITVFSGQRFFVELLCWLEGSTSIHQHGFSGAFQVVAGGSIHCRYHFEESERINSRLRLGQLVFEDAELLQPGDCRPIASGPRFVHSTFHLEKPTVTLVVRTLGDSEAYPQLSYLSPHLAYDPFAKDALLDRRGESFEFLLQAKPMAFLALLQESLPQFDFEMAYRVLCSSHLHLKDGPLFQQILRLMRDRFGHRVDQVQAVLTESERKADLKRKREAASDPGERFRLALEQNVPDLSRARSLLNSRFPSRNPAPAAT